MESNHGIDFMALRYTKNLLVDHDGVEPSLILYKSTVLPMNE